MLAAEKFTLFLLCCIIVVIAVSGDAGKNFAHYCVTNSLNSLRLSFRKNVCKALSKNVLFACSNGTECTMPL